MKKNTNILTHTVLTYYTLDYTVMTSEGIKIVENYTNITRSFCDLTDVWEDMQETYFPMVKGLRVKMLLFLCVGDIMTMKMS